MIKIDNKHVKATIVGDMKNTFKIALAIVRACEEIDDEEEVKK